MKIKYNIHATVEGPLEEIINAVVPNVELADVMASMKEMAFIVETMAHLRGQEDQLLPVANKARALIEKLGG